MTSDLPTGTVTFLFTDIEGSTDLAQQHHDALPALLARHHALLQQAIEANHGHVFQIIGDSFHVAFHTAPDAIQAALDAQRLLQHEAWNPAPIKVRMGINTGAAQAVSDDDRSGGYSGYSTLARVQRVMSTAYGGQVLLSNASAELVQDELPTGVTLRDMGEHHLKGLTNLERLWQIAAPDLISDFPPLATLSVVPNNLPTQLTSFIGREKEIADVKRLLLGTDGVAAHHRMVTLTAVGGTGKTRLSIEVGTQVLASFPQGIWMIELAPLTDPAQIMPALAQVFGLQEIPSRSLAVQTIDYLREKKALLILDNCEHLIDACAQLADDLLHHCAHLQILASSREALGIAGEATYRIPSLAAAESTQLFVERARAANSNFKLTDTNAAAINQICRRLDGIPLALELAAARIKSLSPDQLAARLDDRFRLLVGGSRTALPRQQTLRALIDWSYDLLSDAEKHLLQFASVFVGGWTLEALEAVADDPDTLELLDQLVNKSLVLTEDREGELRYAMLETIRQYAREKLFDAKQGSLARDRHFAYFNGLSEELWQIVQSSAASPLVYRIEAEVENLRAALEWGLENHVDENLQLAASFCALSSFYGIMTEGLNAAKTAIERVRALPPAAADAELHRQQLIGRILFAQTLAASGLGDFPLVHQASKEAIALSRVTGDQIILGFCLASYYMSSTFVKAPDAESAARESLDIFTHSGQGGLGLGMAYMVMAILSAGSGAEDEAKMYLAKVNDMLHELPESYMVGLLYFSMGMFEAQLGNYESAKTIFNDAIPIFKRMHHLYYQLALQSEIGHIERHTGHLAQARAVYHETIKGWQAIGNRGAVAHQLESYAAIALAEAEPQRAAKLLGAAEALRNKDQFPMSDYEQHEYDQNMARLHTMLTDAEFNARWAEGRSLSMAQAVQLAVS